MKNFLFVIILFLVGCKTTQLNNLERATSVKVKMITTGLMDCYPNGLMADSTNALYAEASAAVKINENILIAIDKNVPNGYSPVFTIPSNEAQGGSDIKVNYINAMPFLQVTKIEAFAKSPNDSVFFATTAFDRIRGNSASWDRYNALLSWKKADFSDVNYVSGTTRDGVMSSRDLRISIQKALINPQFPDGAPYFKIEALAVLPGNRLIFGVREFGESFEKFEYAFILLETTYKDMGGKIELNPNFKKVYEYQPIVNGRKMGISDLAYHAPSNSLIVLTSYEEITSNEKVKALYSSLWFLPVTKMEKGEALIPVTQDGRQWSIRHKGEGLTLLNDRTVFMVYDEDRKDSQVTLGDKTVGKLPHQAIFSIIKF